MRFSRAILVGVALLAAPLRADLSQKIPTLPGSGVAITISTPVMQVPHFGFLPMRVTIENTTSSEHTWSLSFEVGQQRVFPGVLTTDFSLTVPAGQTRETWCYVPLHEAGMPSAIVTNALGAAPLGGFATRAANQPIVKITTTPTGVKVTRSFPAGMPFSGPMSEEEINKTTGERTSVYYSSTGAVMSRNSSTPPQGSTVTFTIDPATGTVNSNFSGSSSLPGAPTKITITTASAGASTARVGSSQAVSNKVTITDTPTGKKITRVTSLSSGRAMINETEIDTTTGKVATTTMDDSGTVLSSRQTPPPSTVPGTEVTFNVDQTTGTYYQTTRRVGGTAPTKYLIAVGARGPSLSVPNARWSNGGSMPVMLEASGAGLVGVTRTAQLMNTGATPMRLFAVGQSLEATVRKSLALVVRGGAPSLSTVEPAQLPADWRMWSPFAGVILSAEDYAGLDPARRAALRGWVAMGGHLFLSPAFSGTARTEKIGAGEITTWAEPIGKFTDSATVEALKIQPPPPATGADAQRLAALGAEVARRQAIRDGAAAALGGGGTLTLSSGGGSAVLTSSATVLTVAESPLVDFWINSVKIYEGTPGQPNRDALFLRKTKLAEAADRDDSGGSWLAVFLFVFAAVVAPINLFVFAPAGKRHRLFWTTPLISAAGAVTLTLFIIFQDGLGGSGRRLALVAFVPGGNEAAIFQEQAESTGFLTARGFALNADTIMAELNLDDAMPFMSDSRFHRAEARADGDWFRNRASEAHLLRRLAPTRGRVELVGTAADGAPIVQSNLGVALQDFSCVDETGKLWKTDELAPGRRVTLTRGRVWFATLAAPKASKNFSDALAAAAPQAALHWGARGAGSELAPIATLDSIKWEATEVLYTGVLERSAAAKGAAQ